MNGYHYWKERVNETKQDKLRKKRSKENSYEYPFKKRTSKERNTFTQCGFTNEGRMIYHQILKIMIRRRKNVTHWNKFIDAWKHFCKEEDIGVLSGTRRKRMRQKEQVCENAHEYQPLRFP